MINTKVCIVGSGPAGIAASLFLSQRKIDHIILEKDVFPRHKVCGECYDGRVTRILDEIDSSIIPEMLQRNIIQHTYHYTLLREPGKVFNINAERNKKTPRIQTERWFFDDYLIKKARESAYLRFFDNRTVVSIEKKEDSFVVATRGGDLVVEASFLLMACGSDSRLTRNFLGDVRPQSPNHFIFERLYFQLKRPFPDRSVTIHYCVKPFVHALVVCPTPGNRVNIEIAIDRVSFQTNKPDLIATIRKFVQSGLVPSSVFEGAEEIYKPMGAAMTLHNPALSYTGERFIIVGDAAFCSNPLAGLGVGQAMTMGKQAALAIADCFEKNDFSKTRVAVYEQQIGKKFAKEMMQGKLITLLFRSPALMDKLFAAVTFSPAISRFLSRLVTRLF